MKTFLKIPLFVLLLVQVCLAQWVQTNGPYGGTNNCLAVSGTNLFAGTSGDGVFFSNNRGTSWSAIGLTDYLVIALSVSDDNLFAGTQGYGVFLSSNNGTSWSAVNQGLLKNQYGYISIESFALIDTNLIAGTDEGVFLSNNNGKSWTAVNNGLTNIDVQCFAVKGTNLFAGTGGGGVFFSTNNGTSWTAGNTGLTNTDIEALIISDTNLFAGTGGGGVFLSTNNGTSWTEVNTDLTNTDIRVLAVSEINLFAGTADGVFLSTNNGSSWTAVNTGLICTDIYTLAILDNYVFAGTLNGTFLSTNNGLSWKDVSNGITTGIESLEAIGTSIFAGNGGVYRLDNNETSWTRLNLQLSFWQSISCFANIESNLFAGTRMAFGDGSGVFLSTDKGTNWTAVNSGLTEPTVSALAVSGTNLFAGTSGGVFLSTNHGTSWTAVNAGLTCLGVVTLAIIDTNLFAGTYCGGGGVFRSTNNGTSWTNVGLSNANVFALAVSGTNLFAGTLNNGIFLSTNNGASWTSVSSGLPPDNLDPRAPETINCITTVGTNIFAAPEHYGVFLSTNNGMSWSAFNTGLTNTDVSSIDILGTNIFAGTGNGVWRRPLAEMITEVGNATELPKSFVLYQNYPNPFNPTTTIKYSIPKAVKSQKSKVKNVTLKIFDVLGREVAILVNETKQPGNYEVEFDGRNLVSGVYFYQLRAGSYVETKKMVLMR